MIDTIGAFVTRAAAAAGALVLLAAAAAAQQPKVTAQPDPGPAAAPYALDPDQDPPLPEAAMTALLRDKIKYVFVDLQREPFLRQ